MSKLSRGWRELRSASQEAEHAVVLPHGIRMDASAMRPFANAIHHAAPTVDIHLFDYDWTQSIRESGRELFTYVQSLRYPTLTLVGYSMGGLISRLAATYPLASLSTVITVATPNRGAISTAQLAPLGQSFLDTLKLVSPFFPCRGILDLTEADDILHDRRDEAGVHQAVAKRRYASVPALYYHPQRPHKSRSSAMGVPSAFIEALSFTRLNRPHDGIVTEDSNNLVLRNSSSWDEIDFASYDGHSPARAHAVHHAAREFDHSTVLGSSSIANLVAQLVVTPDWATLPQDPNVRLSFKG